MRKGIWIFAFPVFSILKKENKQTSNKIVWWMLAWLIFSVFWNCFDFKVILVRHSVEKSSPTLAVVDTTWSNFIFFLYRLLLCSISFHMFLNTVQPEVFFVTAWGFHCNSQSVFVKKKKKETYAWPVQFSHAAMTMYKKAVDKTRNTEHSGTSRNIPEHEKIKIIFMKKK